MSTQPPLTVPDTLLDEYGLTRYHLEIMRLCVHPTFWKQGGLNHSITALYKLIDRGLLTGPKRGQPYSVPFQLTPAGKDLLGKIHRGLHHTKWLSETKLAVLMTLSDDGLCTRRKLIDCGGTAATITSLQKAGYIFQPLGNIDYALTMLGREALADWGRSQIPPLPAGTPSRAGGRL